jgi:hypothetical protein
MEYTVGKQFEHIESRLEALENAVVEVGQVLKKRLDENLKTVDLSKEDAESQDSEKELSDDE